MRVLNINDLRGDVLLYFGFGGQAPRDLKGKRYVEWLLKAWVKHFSKTQDGFFHPVVVRKLGFITYHGQGPEPVKLRAETPNGNIDLDPESEWDAKDAENGTLVYYAPSSATIFKYANDLANVRDYLYSVMSDPTVDINKRGYTVVKQSADAWHAEQQRLLQARIAAEAAISQAQSKAGPDFRSLERGTDWWTCSDPFTLNGDNFQLIRLASSRALDYESFVMEHCVHSYRDRLFDGQTVILSVRNLDNFNVPLITAEICTFQGLNPYFVQIKGKYNHEADQTIKGIQLHLNQMLSKGAIHQNGIEPLSVHALTFRVQGTD